LQICLMSTLERERYAQDRLKSKSPIFVLIIHIIVILVKMFISLANATNV